MPKLKTILLVANGDLRQSANEVCWPAQHAMEQALAAAAQALGHEPVIKADLLFQQGRTRLGSFDTGPSPRVY